MDETDEADDDAEDAEDDAQYAESDWGDEDAADPLPPRPLDTHTPQDMRTEPPAPSA
jgi:hypothetical protein